MAPRLRSHHTRLPYVQHQDDAIMSKDLFCALKNLLPPLDYRGVRAFASHSLLSALHTHPKFHEWKRVAATFVPNPILIDAHVMVKVAQDDVPQPSHRDLPLMQTACNQIMNVWEHSVVDKRNGMTVIDGNRDLSLSYGGVIWHDASVLHHASGNPSEEDRRLLFLVWVTSHVKGNTVFVPSPVKLMMKSWKTIKERYTNITHKDIRIK